MDWVIFQKHRLLNRLFDVFRNGLVDISEKWIV